MINEIKDNDYNYDENPDWILISKINEIIEWINCFEETLKEMNDELRKSI